ncbi:MAG: site-specific DNA-methyltransferase [Bacteroidetes bacterium]|nr:site-specific DNA-methyltransferase [Bacteroidota bacterium]
MPTLNWIGKDKVINHHQDVPFRVLDHQYGYTPDGKQEAPVNSGNLIIHGDNLEALKALLPQYEAKVKCIYIDPPYNTGNEGWAYNDNVNDPKIKKWLHQVVGKEGEDLSRHDKWLCMMYPRLVLLNKLLNPDGTVFISIDENVHSYLKIICDEIFGRPRFIASFIWKARQNKDNRNINKVSIDHEYVLCYGRQLKGLPRINDSYSNSDSDPRGPWTSANMVGLLDANQRPNLHYDIIDPSTGVVYKKPKMGWRYDQNTMRRLIQENRIIFPKAVSGRPRRKVYLSDLQSDVTGFSSVTGEDIYTRDGTNVVFGERIFEFPKPVALVEQFILQASDKNDIVMDSFAGSGTTAHAVLNLNKQDGGNRKFILVEMEDYAETITAERVKRVINGYADVEGTGGSFDYYELGPPLFDDAGNLNNQVPVNRIREYIWYSETRSAFNTLTEDQLQNPYFLGIKEDTGYYFYYEPQQVTTLDYDFLGTIYLKAEQYVVYADNCLLSKTFLQNNNIIFKKIPRDISRL